MISQPENMQLERRGAAEQPEHEAQPDRDAAEADQPAADPPERALGGRSASDVPGLVRCRARRRAARPKGLATRIRGCVEVTVSGEWNVIPEPFAPTQPTFERHASPLTTPVDASRIITTTNPTKEKRVFIGNGVR